MHLDNTVLVETVGYLAAAAGLYGTYARTMIPLRMASIVANVLFISYGLLKGIYPTILVNCVLLPLNFIRLRDMRSLITRVQSAAEGDHGAGRGRRPQGSRTDCGVPASTGLRGCARLWRRRGNFPGAETAPGTDPA